MHTPAVSVLIPVRNAERTLRAALASLQAQSFERWEAVIVDDGSTDDTPRLLLEHARDRRLRVERIPAQGIDAALNHGLSMCRAPLVARFDADDLMHRHRLGAQVTVLEADASLCGVGGLVRCFPRVTLRDGFRRYESWLNGLVRPAEIAAARFVEAPLVHPSVTLRRSVLEEMGGWHATPWPEDWNLWLRLLEAGHRLGKVERVVHFWRDRAERLTRTDRRYSPEARTTARAHYLARGPLRGRRAVIWGAGPVGKQLLKALDREGVTVSAMIEVDPRKIGQRLHGRPVVRASDVGAYRDAILLGAVGVEGAREEIRDAAVAAGFVEGESYFACA